MVPPSFPCPQLHDAESQLKVLRSSDTASKGKVASLQEELEEHLEEANSLRTALQVCVVCGVCGVWCVCVCVCVCVGGWVQVCVWWGVGVSGCMHLTVPVFLCFAVCK